MVIKMQRICSRNWSAKYVVYAKGSFVQDVHLSGGTKQGTFGLVIPQKKMQLF